LLFGFVFCLFAWFGSFRRFDNTHTTSFLLFIALFRLLSTIYRFDLPSFSIRLRCLWHLLASVALPLPSFAFACTVFCIRRTSFGFATPFLHLLQLVSHFFESASACLSFVAFTRITSLFVASACIVLPSFCSARIGSFYLCIGLDRCVFVIHLFKRLCRFAFVGCDFVPFG
jgi:hypothetical protein